MSNSKITTKASDTQISKDIEKGVPPEKFTEGHISKPSEYAAGLKGVAVSIQHLSSERSAGAVASIMPKMNQFDGFDCPGCAWPDPDEKRSFLGEYCENGAKAVAEEATTKKADPDFWAKYSVNQLLNFTDFYELSIYSIAFYRSKFAIRTTMTTM